MIREMEDNKKLYATVENRKDPRIEVKWPITVSTHDRRIKGETISISVGGIFICSDKPLPINKAFFMSVNPPHHQAIEFAGKVVWSNFYGIDDQSTVFAMGISFVKLSDRDRYFLVDFVASQLENH
jgi:c-di-GMP-binding flagellar brake protein YcgR